MPSLRERLETASLPFLTRISALPRWAPFLVVLGLLVAGMFIRGWGWVFTAVVVLFLAWLLALSWPRLTAVERLMRSAVILLAMVVAVVQASPRS